MAEKHVSAPLGAINPRILSTETMVARLAQTMRQAILTERMVAIMSGRDPKVDDAIRVAERAWRDMADAAAAILAEAPSRPDIAVLIAAIVEKATALRDTEEGEQFMADLYGRRVDLWLAACRIDQPILRRLLTWCIDALEEMAELDTFGAVAPSRGPEPTTPARSQDPDLDLEAA